MFDVGIAAKCWKFKRYVLRLDLMLRELSEFLMRETRVFSWENVCGPSQKHSCGQKKTEDTSSAMFGVGTAAKCYAELKRCADRVHSRTQETESSQRQISVRILNFSPSTFTV